VLYAFKNFVGKRFMSDYSHLMAAFYKNGNLVVCLKLCYKYDGSSFKIRIPPKAYLYGVRTFGHCNRYYYLPHTYINRKMQLYSILNMATIIKMNVTVKNIRTMINTYTGDINAD